MRAAADRGTAVHTICEYHDRGQEQIVEPAYVGYFAAWLAFVEQVSPEMVEIELKVGGEKLGFVGRLDRVCVIKKKTWVIDIKSGRPWPTHGPQTAAYEFAYRSEYFPRRLSGPFRRACVHLARDGKYTLVEHASVHDLHTYLAYLRIARFEIENGLRPQPRERD